MGRGEGRSGIAGVICGREKEVEGRGRRQGVRRKRKKREEWSKKWTDLNGMWKRWKGVEEGRGEK